MNNPSDALRHFNQYLLKNRGGGVLAREAELGRIRSLRKLNRRTEEIFALRQFLVKYPDSMMAPAVSNRLTELTGEEEGK